MSAAQGITLALEKGDLQGAFDAAERLADANDRAREILARIVERCVDMSRLRERHEEAEAIERLALDAIAALSGDQP